MVRQIEGVGEDPRVTLHRFDGYDREVEITDPMGNVSHLKYDSNSNSTHRSSEGELFEDSAGGAANVRLVEETRVFDAMDRLIRQGIAHFDPISQAPIGDGGTTTEVEYTPRSDPSRILDDNGNATFFLYDTTYEVREVTDAAGNSMAFEYDENRNLLRVTETERSGFGGAEETYVTLWEYDSENRPRDRQANQYSATPFDNRSYDRNGNVVRIDPTARGGSTKRLSYDYRDQLVRYADPRVRVSFSYDVFGRLPRRKSPTRPSETLRPEVYGAWECTKLALSDSESAVINADNYAYFARDLAPIASCNPLALGFHARTTLRWTGGRLVSEAPSLANDIWRGLKELGGWAESGLNWALGKVNAAGSTAWNVTKRIVPFI